MSKPYAKTNKMGDLLFTPVQFAAVATQADKAGLIVHVHAIGDLGITTALDGFAAARKPTATAACQTPSRTCSSSSRPTTTGSRLWASLRRSSSSGPPPMRIRSTSSCWRRFKIEPLLE
jgi:hypothetical protein